MILKKINLNFIIPIISIFLLTTITIYYFSNSKNSNTNNDLKYFNQLTQENLDKEICNKIDNQNIKEKCMDNFYSITAFNKEDEKNCNKIITKELKSACINNIKKFKE